MPADTPGERALYVSTEVWKRARQRAGTDRITVKDAFHWMLHAYTNGTLDVPLTPTPRATTRRGHGVNPDPETLAEAEQRAATAGFTSFSAFAEVLLKNYADGEIIFTPTMHRRTTT